MNGHHARPSHQHSHSSPLAPPVAPTAHDAPAPKRPRSDHHHPADDEDAERDRRKAKKARKAARRAAAAASENPTPAQELPEVSARRDKAEKKAIRRKRREHELGENERKTPEAAAVRDESMTEEVPAQERTKERKKDKRKEAEVPAPDGSREVNPEPEPEQQEATAKRDKAEKKAHRRAKRERERAEQENAVREATAVRDKSVTEEVPAQEGTKKKKKDKRDGLEVPALVENREDGAVPEATKVPLHLRYAAEQLATHWLSPAAHLALSKAHAFPRLLGPFTPSERTLIDRALSTFSTTHRLSPSRLSALISAERPARNPDVLAHEFWPAIARAVPFRPVSAVYKFVKRHYGPAHRKGPWTPDEVLAIRTAHGLLGPSWVEIADRVGRQPGDCRDWWRDHGELPPKGGKTGKWDEDEVSRLEKAVRKLGAQNWKLVAKEVGTRTRRKCITMWQKLEEDEKKRKEASASSAPPPVPPTTVGTKTKTKTKPLVPRFVNADRPALVAAVRRLKPSDATKIPWSLVLSHPKTAWNIKSRDPVRLATVWRTLLAQARTEGKTTSAKQLKWLGKRYPKGQKYMSDTQWAKQSGKKGKKGEASTSAAKGEGNGKQQQFKSAEFVSESDGEGEVVQLDEEEEDQLDDE